jgi:type IV pilus assembly protein PilE
MNRPAAHRAGAGWTLIELLLVLGIVGLLAQWAWPLGADLMQRARRNEARLVLLQTAHWLERYAAAQGRYPDALSDNVWRTDSLSYRLSYTGSEQSYTLLAIPLGAQVQDPCGSLSLDAAGTREVRDARWSALTCWSR